VAKGGVHDIRACTRGFREKKEKRKDQEGEKGTLCFSLFQTGNRFALLRSSLSVPATALPVKEYFLIAVTLQEPVKKKNL